MSNGGCQIVFVAKGRQKEKLVTDCQSLWRQFQIGVEDYKELTYQGRPTLVAQGYFSCCEELDLLALKASLDKVAQSYDLEIRLEREELFSAMHRLV